MKNLLFVFIGVLLLTAGKPAHQTKDSPIDIARAVSEQKIELTVTGNDESPLYYQPILVNLKNLTNEEVVINIKNGQLFKSTDPEIQDIIVTQEEMIVLKGFDHISKPIFGMCVQQYYSAPGFTQEYRLDKIATENLASIANQIQEQEAFSIAGQNFILTHNKPLDYHKYLSEAFLGPVIIKKKCQSCVLHKLTGRRDFGKAPTRTPWAGRRACATARGSYPGTSALARLLNANQAPCPKAQTESGKTARWWGRREGVEACVLFPCFHRQRCFCRRWCFLFLAFLHSILFSPCILVLHFSQLKTEN
jgi:hypothetical protein